MVVLADEVGDRLQQLNKIQLFLVAAPLVLAAGQKMWVVKKKDEVICP